ncbi:DUF1043 family protein [Pasteurellaceae bacterium LIM206]|nr:DUF1043 family protein [Pasteurellaceae bacterium LIM206]
MPTWTPEMWQTAGIGLVIGFIAGYLFLRIGKGSIKKQLQTETELKAVKAQIETQKLELEKHFAESAELLKNLAQDYQKLYSHLANSSAALLPNSQQKPLFPQNLIERDDTLSGAANNVNNNEEKLKPKDYSEGSSGLLKAEK